MFIPRLLISILLLIRVNYSRKVIMVALCKQQGLKIGLTFWLIVFLPLIASDSLATIEDREDFVSEKWESSQILDGYSISSHLPIWFVDVRDSRVYMVFDEKVRLNASVKIVGTMRSSSRDDFLNYRSFVDTKDVSTLETISRSSKAYIYAAKMSREEAWVLAVEHGQLSGGIPIVLPLSGDIVFAILSDVQFDLSKDTPRTFCLEHNKYYKTKCRKMLKDRALVMGTSLAEEMKAKDDLKLIKTCDIDYFLSNSHRYIECYTRTSRINSKEHKAIESELKDAKFILRDKYWYENGQYDLIGFSSHDYFSSTYNTDVLRELNSRGAINTQAFDRLDIKPVEKLFKKIIPVVIVCGIFLGMAVYRFTRSHLVTSFFVAQALFFIPVIVPYAVGMGFVSSYLYISIIQVFYIGPEYLGGVFKVWGFFSIYWFAVHKFTVFVSK